MLFPQISHEKPENINQASSVWPSWVVLVVKNPLAHAGEMRQFPSLGWGDPLEKGMAMHSSTLAWKFHGQRSLVGYSPYGCKETKLKQLGTHMYSMCIFL